MTVSRRRLVRGAAALTVVVLSGRLVSLGHAPSHALSPSNNLVPPGRHVLLLHDGSAAGLALAQTLRESACRVSECAVTMLTLAGFNQAGALLDEARGGTLLALFDDADTVVVEALLKARNIGTFARQRHGCQVLLTARLQQ